MIVRTREQLKGTKSNVSGPFWSTTRFLLKEDGMGFTLSETIVNFPDGAEAGEGATLEYKNHFEACYCVEGELEVEDLTTGEVHHITPGTVYALDKHDRHKVRAKGNVRLICGFSPALVGPETHDADGSYPASD